jgi:hypothetical protein
MKSVLPIAAALLASAGLLLPVAQAQQVESAPQVEQSNTRISQLIIYGNDPCPRATRDDEAIVCIRRPENDRFRIPENLRRPNRRGQSESWATTAQSMEYLGRTGIQSCSTVGPNGSTGCWEEMMRQVREDRRVNPQGQPIP